MCEGEGGIIGGMWGEVGDRGAGERGRGGIRTQEYDINGDLPALHPCPLQIQVYPAALRLAVQMFAPSREEKQGSTKEKKWQLYILLKCPILMGNR